MVVVKVASSSQPILSGVTITPTYTILLFAIPKTEEPVRLKGALQTSVRLSSLPVYEKTALPQKSGSVYMIQGRVLSGKIGTYAGLTISPSGNSGEKRHISMR